MAKPQANLTSEECYFKEEFGTGYLNASPLEIEKSKSSG